MKPNIKINTVLRLWLARWLARQRMKSLAHHDPDWLLDDIGRTREEVWREAQKPFWRP